MAEEEIQPRLLLSLNNKGKNNWITFKIEQNFKDCYPQRLRIFSNHFITIKYQ